MILWAWELPYLHWQESLQFSLLVSFVCSLCGRLPSISYRLTSEMSRGEDEGVMWLEDNAMVDRKMRENH